MENALFGNPLVRETDNGIMLDNVSLRTIANDVPTPFYIMIGKKIRDNIRLLQKVARSFFPTIRISYSVKANFMDLVLREVHNQNLTFDIISSYEYRLLKRNSANCDNLIVGGPYLPDSLIESALQEKNPLFVLYNPDQIQRLNMIAKSKNFTPNALLRFVAPKTQGHLGFTSNESTYYQLSNLIPNCSNITFQGVHSHYGTQINTIETYRKNILYLTEIAKHLEERGIFKTKIFDIGGGLPNAGTFKENKLISIFRVMKEEFGTQGFPDTQICIEPGRYIVEDAGLFLMEIISASDDGHTCFVNSGTHNIPRFARNSLRFYNVDQPLSHYNHKTTIYGIVPSEEDILMKNYNFSEKNEIGNKIMVMNCGAYAYTFSTRFPYHLPSLVYINDGTYEVHTIVP